MDVPTEQPTTHKRFGIKLVFFVMCVVLLPLVAYIAKLTLNYYERIQQGTLDLSTFEQGGQTTLTSQPQVGTIRSTAVENFAGDPSIGPDNAALTIVMFEDFQCPFCRDAFPTVRGVIAQYSDRVRFVYRDFPISELHADAQKAAEAGQCAHEQGQFWPYHDKLFLNADHLTVPDLKLYAQQLHLDTHAFDNCLESGKYTEEVLADFDDGINAGVTGTPTFFFNGNRVAGTPTEEGFAQIIAYFL